MTPATPPAAPPHDRIQDLLAVSLDGPLDPADQAEVDRHLSECVECRVAGSGLAADASQLRDIAAVAAPDWVAAIVFKAAAERRPTRERSRGPGRLRLLAAAVGVVLVIGVFVALGQALC